MVLEYIPEVNTLIVLVQVVQHCAEPMLCFLMPTELALYPKSLEVERDCVQT